MSPTRNSFQNFCTQRPSLGLYTRVRNSETRVKDQFSIPLTSAQCRQWQFHQYGLAISFPYCSGEGGRVGKGSFNCPWLFLLSLWRRLRDPVPVRMRQKKLGLQKDILTIQAPMIYTAPCNVWMRTYPLLAPNGTRLSARCHFTGPNPLPLPLVMDMHASNTLCTGLHKSQVHKQLLSFSKLFQAFPNFSTFFRAFPSFSKLF